MPGMHRKQETGCQWCDTNIRTPVYGYAKSKAHPLIRPRGTRMAFCSNECKTNWRKAMEDAGYETK